MRSFAAGISEVESGGSSAASCKRSFRNPGKVAPSFLVLIAGKASVVSSEVSMVGRTVSESVSNHLVTVLLGG